MNSSGSSRLIDEKCGNLIRQSRNGWGGGMD
jgi:hypothetical protein